MALSVFDDPTDPPTDERLGRALGPAMPLWTRLVSEVSRRHPPIEAQWAFAGPKFGWSMRLRRGERAILHLTPCDRHFLVGAALGEPAVAAARSAGLPHAIESALDQSPRYAEGRGLRFAVRTEGDVSAAVVIADAKVGPGPMRRRPKPAEKQRAKAPGGRRRGAVADDPAGGDAAGRRRGGRSG